jgi:hypothetical protein
VAVRLRFRRHAFGWRSDTPIARIKEALSEIKQVARKEPVLAAEGAITLLEKLSPALEQVDSSSGALGSAVNKAIEALVPLIAKADVDSRIRQRWLERLWVAIDNDDEPYLETLSDFWGELCVTTDLASSWADEFLPTVERVWSPDTVGYRGRINPALVNSSMHCPGLHSLSSISASSNSSDVSIDDSNLIRSAAFLSLCLAARLYQT